LKVVVWLCGIIAVVMVFFGLVVIYILPLDDKYSWDLNNTIASQNGEYKLYEYSYTNDYNRHAPYGQYLYLKSIYNEKAPLDSYLIFAGYCGESLSYSWINDMHIMITCKSLEKNSIRTLAGKAFGIQISLKSATK
jgi:hypothetical protein